jgi:hypothetical protein
VISFDIKPGPKKKSVTSSNPKGKPGRKSITEMDIEYDGPPEITIIPDIAIERLAAKPDISKLANPDLPFYYSLRFTQKFDLEVDGSWYTGRALYYEPNTNEEWDLVV